MIPLFLIIATVFIALPTIFHLQNIAPHLNPISIWRTQAAITLVTFIATQAAVTLIALDDQLEEAEYFYGISIDLICEINLLASLMPSASIFSALFLI